MRAISRVTGVSINTVTKLLEDAGETCIALHDERVRDVKSQRIQCDEIWSFNYCKKVKLATAKPRRTMAGDVWTWTAIDGDSKLMVSYFVGDRDASTRMIHAGLALACRQSRPTHHGRPSPVSDCRRGCLWRDVDYAHADQAYSETPDRGPDRKYSPGVCTGVGR